MFELVRIVLGTTSHHGGLEINLGVNKLFPPQIWFMQAGCT